MIARSWLLTLLALGLRAAEPSTIAAPASPAPPIRQISDTLFDLDHIRFDKKAKTAQFDCDVNMNKDLIEYVLVAKGGKRHESLLITEIEPASLHVVMLLLGAKPSTEVAGVSTNAPPWIDASTLRGAPPIVGSPVTLHVGWEVEGVARETRIEDWIYNKQTGYAMKPSGWVYNGSRLINHSFMATRERSIVALVTDPFALINHTGKGHDDDTIWAPLNEKVPPKGTRVRLTIHLGDGPPPSL